MLNDPTGRTKRAYGRARPRCTAAVSRSDILENDKRIMTPKPAETATNGAVQAESLVPEASSYVYDLFKEKLPATITYHTYLHTVEVAKAAAKIGRKSGLGRNENALVTLAAWFHDTGFTETYEHHEETGIRIAQEYLRERGLSEEQIARVAAYIRATGADQAPQNPGERVIRDADMSHVGSKNYQERSEQLRREWATHRNRTYSDEEWAELQLGFLASVSFHTEYAQKKYRKQWARNLRAVQQTLAGFLERQRTGDRPAAGPREVPTRGIETMFRSAYRNHINLSSIADSKANIMISVNAILMSIIISYVSTRLQMDPWLMIPATSLLLTSLIAIIFAILSARPKVTSKVFSVEDVRQNRANILFFGNFVNMSLDEFTIGMRGLMEDWDTLYNNMISDIYSLGGVLRRKYHLLHISYTVFMAGLTLSVVLFIVFYYIS